MARIAQTDKAGRLLRNRHVDRAGLAAPTLPPRPVRIRVRHLQPLCLALLAQQPGSGYDVVAALSALPMFARARPDAPGVYRTLQAFAKRGLIGGRRRLSKKGPARCEYTITPAGRACLDIWLETLEVAREELDAVIALVRRNLKPAKGARGSTLAVARLKKGRR